jgi:hypothetical protein
VGLIQNERKKKMSILENERTKARLLAEIESLDEKRKAAETELGLLEKTDVPVLRREAFEKLSPGMQSDFCRDVRSGVAKLID